MEMDEKANYLPIVKDDISLRLMNTCFSFNYFPLLSDLAYNFHIAKMVENDCCKWDVK